jgi:hypothetical protein
MTACRQCQVAWLTLALALGATAGAAPDPADPARPPTTSGASQPTDQPAVTSAPLAPVVAPEPADSGSAPPVAPKPRPRLSADLKAELAGSLPSWIKPPPPPPKAPPPPPPPDAGEDVVQMKPVIVFADKLPRIDEKAWLTPKARDALLEKQYLSEFDRDFLNRYTLPILGISKEARARQMDEENQRLKDQSWMNNQIDQLKRTDPQAAKELQQISDQIFTRTGE